MPPTPKHACPTCGRVFARPDLHRVCPQAPDVRTWLEENLPDAADARYIIPINDFEKLNPPISRAPMLAQYGSWRAVAAAFGLRNRTAERGAVIDGLDPEVAADLQRLARELHGGEFGPSTSEYDDNRSCAITTHGLKHRHGTWSDVLALAGLRAGGMGDYINAANARRKTHQATRPRQNERHSLERGDEPVSREYTGIPVLPEPRPLASGGVAWMIR